MDAPRPTSYMHAMVKDLEFIKLLVIYTGLSPYNLAVNIRTIPS